MSSTTLVTFLLQAPLSVRSVQLLGSWDNFSKPYPMVRDGRTGRCHWRGCHSFTNIICDGESVTPADSRHGGLKMGGKYWYYYMLDDDIEYSNPSEPTTTSCPFLPGQQVNLLEVPLQEQNPHRAHSRRTSAESVVSIGFTLNPDDKYLTPRPLSSSISDIAPPLNWEPLHCATDLSLAERPLTRTDSLGDRVPGTWDIRFASLGSAVNDSKERMVHTSPAAVTSTDLVRDLRPVRSVGGDARCEGFDCFAYASGYRGALSSGPVEMDPGDTTSIASNAELQPSDFLLRNDLDVTQSLEVYASSEVNLSEQPEVSPSLSGSVIVSAPYTSCIHVAERATCRDTNSLCDQDDQDVHYRGNAHSDESSTDTIADTELNKSIERSWLNIDSSSSDADNLEDGCSWLLDELSESGFFSSFTEDNSTSLHDAKFPLTKALRNLTIDTQYSLGPDIRSNHTSEYLSSLDSPSIYTGYTSPTHHQQPLTPTTNLDFDSYFPDNRANVLSDDVSPVDDNFNSRTQSQYNFLGCSLSIADTSSALTLKNLPTRQHSAGSEDLACPFKQRTGQELVEGWDDGLKQLKESGFGTKYATGNPREKSALQELVEEVGYLGNWIN